MFMSCFSLVSLKLVGCWLKITNDQPMSYSPILLIMPGPIFLVTVSGNRDHKLDKNMYFLWRGSGICFFLEKNA